MGHFKDLKAWQHARQLVVLSRRDRPAPTFRARRARRSVAARSVQRRTQYRGGCESPGREGLSQAPRHRSHVTKRDRGDTGPSGRPWLSPTTGLDPSRGYARGVRQDSLRAAEEASRGSEATWTLGSVNRLRLAAGGY